MLLVRDYETQKCDITNLIKICQLFCKLWGTDTLSLESKENVYNENMYTEINNKLCDYYYINIRLYAGLVHFETFERNLDFVSYSRTLKTQTLLVKPSYLTSR
jgi:hypothetical protein